MAKLIKEEFHDGPHYAALKNLAAARNVPLVPILGDLKVELQDFPRKSEVQCDMEKGFIWAEVMSFDDLARLGSPARVREAGRLYLEGLGLLCPGR